MEQDSYVEPRLPELNPPVLKEDATKDDILHLTCVSLNCAVYTDSERASIIFEKEMGDPDKIWRLSELSRGPPRPVRVGRNKYRAR